MRVVAGPFLCALGACLIIQIKATLLVIGVTEFQTRREPSRLTDLPKVRQLIVTNPDQEPVNQFPIQYLLHLSLPKHTSRLVMLLTQLYTNVECSASLLIPCDNLEFISSCTSIEGATTDFCQGTSSHANLVLKEFLTL